MDPERMNMESKIQSLQEQLQEYKAMQNVFERRVLDLQSSLREKESYIETLEHNQNSMNQMPPRPNIVDNSMAAVPSYDGPPEDREITESVEQRKMFVGGLNYDSTEQSMANHFGQYGYIADCVVMRDAQRMSRGFGFVVYTKSFMVEKALSIKPHMVDGRTVDIKKAVPKEQRVSVALKESDTNDTLLKKLFVGGLNNETDEESLRSHFSSYGNIADCCVMRDADRRSRRFGFILFDSVENVDEAQAARPHIIDGRTVETKRAVPKGEDKNQQTGVKKIFIGGLRESTSPDMVREFFNEHGRVEEVECPTDSDGKRRGFAYIIFADSDTVDKLVLMKYVVVDGRKCEVKRAMSKYEMGQRAGMSRGRGADNKMNQNNPGWNQGQVQNWNQGGGGQGGPNWNQGGGQGGPNWNQGGNQGWNQGGNQPQGQNWNQGGNQPQGQNWNQGGNPPQGQNWNQGAGNGQSFNQGNQGPNWNQAGANQGQNWNQGGFNQGMGGGAQNPGWNPGSGDNWGNQNPAGQNPGGNWEQGYNQGNSMSGGGGGPVKTNNYSQRYSGPYTGKK